MFTRKYLDEIFFSVTFSPGENKTRDKFTSGELRSGKFSLGKSIFSRAKVRSVTSTVFCYCWDSLRLQNPFLQRGSKIVVD